MKDQYTNQAEAFAAGRAEGRAEVKREVAQSNREKEHAGWKLLEDFREQGYRLFDDLELGLDKILVWSPDRERRVL